MLKNEYMEVHFEFSSHNLQYYIFLTFY